MLQIKKSLKGNYKLCSECISTLLDCVNFRKMIVDTERQYETYFEERVSRSVSPECQIIEESESIRLECQNEKFGINEDNVATSGKENTADENKDDENPIAFTFPESRLKNIKTYTNKTSKDPLAITKSPVQTKATPENDRSQLRQYVNRRKGVEKKLTEKPILEERTVNDKNRNENADDEEEESKVNDIFQIEKETIYNYVIEKRVKRAKNAAVKIEFLEEDRENLLENCANIFADETSNDTYIDLAEETETIVITDSSLRKTKRLRPGSATLPKYNSIISLRPKPTLIFRCNYCTKTFPKKHLIFDHLKTHKYDELTYTQKELEDGEEHACKLCPRICISDASLKRHQDHFHTGKQPKQYRLDRYKYKCMYCDESFTKCESLIKHESKCFNIKSKSSDFNAHAYLCSFCSKTYRFYGSLLKHEGRHKSKHVCNVCFRTFVGDKPLQMHRKLAHEQPLVCSYCGDIFHALSRFQFHVYGHTGKKPFKCDRCDKEFAMEKTLKSHTLFHLGVNSSFCEYCGKVLADRLSLKSHCARVHGAQTPQRMKCLYCDETFDGYRTRAIHTIKVHKPERMVQCKQCPTKFTHRSGLRKHLKTAHGPKEKAHVCEYCARAFAYKMNLKRHLKIHTGERPFQCRHCDKDFIQKVQRQAHEDKHHADPGQVKIT